ncbi:MAG: SAM-dependent DNA methyltransferase [Microcystis sp. M_OC_Ca_00000000_S217Cul]|uniref:site-specific DNA-methyltransferase (adenine-specific) n=1 Tax=Microcystis aeruginosa BLCC-F108 TaxID=2755317 RepID=A0A841UX46_MICAE|nr:MULTISPECIES: N-6 DNA methylase [Microcystis]MBC1193300.1 N-6 DNA methylase [Microcystis aeruginosa BLCC-F108]MCA2592361.1 N-6 DNA methylase [Microcystis sp. M31BS1]MDB9409096.1 N-6 DNA methylase [Microcystis aeruginosa CS-558/01A06]TRT71596.1 MAG: SAM-dependent DNA methyltransferase [Microcystis sp. M_OC_Ca_00000000_S217Cul]TRT84824.1 MAG: SAM-dependent DNA methyltransferase [Microcystis sp. M_OC_Ca_00000000_C217Col]
MAQLDNIEAIEKKLWKAADTLRANSNYASNEYFLPVMGLIFLRHAYSRFLKVKREVEADLPKRQGKTRSLIKEDFLCKGAIYLQEKAQFDFLVALPDSVNRSTSLMEAMLSIEGDYPPLGGILPKTEYQELDNVVLGNLLRILNPEELKKADGDIFGRIYEYFLTQFANLKAHDNGEFFTPVSLVSLIANVLEPDHGLVFDPACGSGGMFVQSAHFVERQRINPQMLTFKGLEKNPTTIRLAKMNLAVHGLEGDIQKAITYYEDPLALAGKVDYVMANPPFNVDEVDSKVDGDERLPFGLPGVNKSNKVSNGNYLWISYFYSYLNDRGKAGFVMSSQASSAGRDEGKVRQKLIETGTVDIMIAIRSNFFYTRSVPCELWFLNRGKPAELQDKILMIDARNIYRKVNRTINDFSPEQLQNILSIVWLYRSESKRFIDLVVGYCQSIDREYQGSIALLQNYREHLDKLTEALEKFYNLIDEKDGTWLELRTASELFKDDMDKYASFPAISYNADDLETLHEAVRCYHEYGEFSRDLGKQADLVNKLLGRAIERAEKDLGARDSKLWWNSRELNTLRKEADTSRQNAIEQLKSVRGFYRHAHWLLERFPDAKLRDVEGLVKVVDREELQANDWSLTPGRYVGVSPEEEDEGFDFEETLREIHLELNDLNSEAIRLADEIAKNFEGLGI